VNRTRSRALAVLGGVLSTVGLLWALQGAGVVGRSVMTDQSEWLVIGVLVLAVGAVLILLGLRGESR
jgi:hypothetical protein